MKKLIILITIVLFTSTVYADEYIKVSNKSVKRVKTVLVEEIYNLDVMLSQKANLKAQLDELNLQITAVRNAGAVAETEVNA